MHSSHARTNIIIYIKLLRNGRYAIPLTIREPKLIVNLVVYYYYVQDVGIFNERNVLLG
jgi:hypothetical protein